MSLLAATPLFAAISIVQGSADSISGGALRLEQAAYDVLSYDISLHVDPAKKTISGDTVIEAKTVIPTATILLDLNAPFTVSKVTDGKDSLRFDRLKDTLRVHFPNSKQPGDPIRIEIEYSGTPRVARNAPWDGGVVWAKTPSGADWVSVALQGDGADLLFPCRMLCWIVKFSGTAFLG